MRRFRITAIIVLLVSLLPDLLMLNTPSVTIAAVMTLIAMHAIAAALSVGLLTTLAREK